MIAETFKIIIERLKEKTSKNEASWSKTNRDTEFKLDFGKGAITIDNWSDSHNEYVDCNILNENGDKVDGVVFPFVEETTNFLYLQELYTMVKRSYYKTDETFENILKELKSDNKIGFEKKVSSQW